MSAQRLVYGIEQEEAARGLAMLLAAAAEPVRPLPHTVEDSQQLIRCRQIALDAITERIALLAAVHGKAPVVGPAEHVRALPHALAWLGAVTGGAARLPWEERSSPLEALGRCSQHRLVEATRTAAARLTTGTYALAAETRWREPAVAWAVVEDMAMTVEVLAQLDAVIAQPAWASPATRRRPTSDATPQLSRADAANSVSATRLGCTAIRQLAGWKADSLTLDEAVAPRPGPVRGGPVHTIRSAGDVAVAHRRLVAFAGHGLARPNVPHVEWRAAVAYFSAEAALLAELVAHLNGPQWEALRVEAQSQLARIQEFLPHSRGLRPGPKYRDQVTPITPLLVQSRELVTGLPMMATLPKAIGVSGVYEVLAYSHQAQQAVARSLLLELHRGDTIRVQHGTARPLSARAVARRQTGQGNTLLDTLDALAHAPVPIPPIITASHQHRETLRASLAWTPPAVAPSTPSL